MNTPSRPANAGVISEVQNLVAIALQTPRSVADVFVEFSAHIDWISVKAYTGGWQENTPRGFEVDCRTDGPESLTDLVLLRDRLNNYIATCANLTDAQRAAKKAEALREAAAKLLAEADALQPAEAVA